MRSSPFDTVCFYDLCFHVGEGFRGGGGRLLRLDGRREGSFLNVLD